MQGGGRWSWNMILNLLFSQLIGSSSKYMALESSPPRSGLCNPGMDLSSSDIPGHLLLACEGKPLPGPPPVAFRFLGFLRLLELQFGET